MKYIAILLSLVFISFCQDNKKTDKPTDEIISETIEKTEIKDPNIDKSSTDNDNSHFRQIGLDEKIGNKTLKEYLSDKKIPQTFKDIFQQKQGLNDDEKTLALLDSLSSTDKDRHPFYFVLVTRTTWWSDGAFSEVLGMSIREYVEANTEQFSTYFLTEPVLTSFDLKHWAKYTLSELMIDSDNDDIQKQIKNTRNLMKKNCIGCSEEKSKLIDRFIEAMYAEYDRIQ